METLPALRRLSLPQLQEVFQDWKEPAFRARQLYDWLWLHPVSSFEAMTNLGKSLRQRLAATYSLQAVETVEARQSVDGSVKFGFRLHDGHIVEGVLIPSRDRMTACISSQVGCSLTCKFCATGYLKMERNLEFYEIYDQVRLIQSEAHTRYGLPLTNIVYMGMGEPLLNYRNVLASINHITAPDEMNFSPRRITVSSAGVAKMIERLGDDGFKCEFALSLHAANDEKRSQIMPINETNSLEALGTALKHFYSKTGTRVTLEYIIFQDVNDSLEDAAELAAFGRTIPTKINIIEYNPIQEASYRNTSAQRMKTFIEYLEKKGFIVNVRYSKGKDVEGACGQLAGKKTSVSA
jgi:23S rRNA (adenine2503-C2)-methyltransferase